MELNLSDEEVDELRVLLDQAIRDLSPEIAGTDNPAYRSGLRGRRELLREIRGRLGA
jgi:hypothetical protein